ncbi:MAG TPA: hypothetical protein PK794_08985, partial [Armatimonadota bacterium]|nr:hypothetical protein [Armatimonadota bacterium]
MRIVLMLMLWCCILPLCAQTPEVAVGMDGTYLLSDFGEIRKMPAARETLEKAAAWITAHGGGVLVVPAGTARELVVRNQFQTLRPDAVTPVLTIIDRRGGLVVTHPPQIGLTMPFEFSGWAGTKTDRTLDTYPDYLPHWGSHTVTAVNNTVLRGSSSVLRTCEVVKRAGSEVWIYPETIRGIFTMPGVSTNIEVKEIYWDTARRQSYFTADVPAVKADGVGQLSNKSNVGSMLITTAHNADSQSFDFHVWREQYGHGDAFVISGWFAYQGDVMSSRGDENGVVLNAEIESDIDPFSAKVEAVDWKHDALTFAPGARNANKLATSRPLINMNPAKWITAGTVCIVPAEDWSGMIVRNPAVQNKVDDYITWGITPDRFPMTYTDEQGEHPSLTTWDGKPVRAFKYVYKDKAYPSLITRGANYLGGRIIASPDCGWTPEVVGRFFAVAEEGEYVSGADGGGYFCGGAPDKAYRWYLIRAFKKNPDGTCEIRIERVRFAAVAAGGPTLYDEEHYTWDGHERPLTYIIAPGAFVSDIAEGWQEGMNSSPGAAHPRTLKLADGPYRGTATDFAPGDPVTQAVGADPVFPRGVRVRQFNKLPSSWPTSAVEISNHGLVSTYAALLIGGDGMVDRDLVLAHRKDRKPPHGSALSIDSVTGAGIRFNADVTEGALVFEQPAHEQPLVWKSAAGKTVLMVNPKSGNLSISGG